MLLRCVAHLCVRQSNLTTMIKQANEGRVGPNRNVTERRAGHDGGANTVCHRQCKHTSHPLT